MVAKARDLVAQQTTRHGRRTSIYVRSKKSLLLSTVSWKQSNRVEVVLETNTNERVSSWSMTRDEDMKYPWTSLTRERIEHRLKYLNVINLTQPYSE